MHTSAATRLTAVGQMGKLQLGEQTFQDGNCTLYSSNRCSELEGRLRGHDSGWLSCRSPYRFRG